MNVSYDYYRIFYYVAKYHSFTSAAKILMNSQPNITRAMNNLEHELGCQLFYRSHRGTTLTPEGEKLFRHIAIAHEQIVSAEAELQSDQTLQSGYISIGTSEIALHTLLLPVLSEFQLSYPGVHIQITNHSTSQAVDALKSGMVELAVVTSPTGVSSPITEIPLLKFHDILVAGPRFSAFAKKNLTLQEIVSYPFICLNRDTKTYEFFDHIFTKYHADFQPNIFAATTDQILPMVKHNLGLGFLPESFAREAIDSGDIFKVSLREDIPCRSICLIWDKSRPLGIAARKLTSMLKANSSISF